MWKHEKIKALQSIEGELVNNTSKWTEIDEHITKDSKTIKKKLEMILLILKKKGSYIETG